MKYITLDKRRSEAIKMEGRGEKRRNEKTDEGKLYDKEKGNAKRNGKLGNKIRKST